MDSPLSPREIQARIRAGESPSDIARSYGVDSDRIERYAGPVLAERQHTIDLAKDSQVRRRANPGIHRTLMESVQERLGHTQVAWDARRTDDRPGRHWTVGVSWSNRDEIHQAEFDFDPHGRFSVAVNDDARWLVRDARTPITSGWRPSTNPDLEPTVDLHDELALVRAVQDDEPQARQDEPPGPLDEMLSGLEPPDYLQGQLAQVDGIYDIVENPRSDMDVLYEMLSTFDEDSVNIYEGLTTPVAGLEPPEERSASPVSSEQEPQVTPAGSPQGHSSTTGPAGQASQQQDRQPTTPAQTDQQQDARTPQQQEPLPDAPAQEHPKSHRRKRATVPTWDEIIFGGPQPPRES